VRATSPAACATGPLVVGGDGCRRARAGWYVRPTLFADVDNRMRIAREEIFGPC
jgi:acyl-CoA reductase-like NAD-dependent aldehyde dehydrogenase